MRRNPHFPSILEMTVLLNYIECSSADIHVTYFINFACYVLNLGTLRWLLKVTQDRQQRCQSKAYTVAILV